MVKTFVVCGFRILAYMNALVRFLLRNLYKKRFQTCGENVKFSPYDQFSFGTISIGNDVFIASRAWFVGEIYISDKVLFGPNVVILGGDHNTLEVGQYIFDVKTKRDSQEGPIVIETDVWIGANTTILKNITIQRGTIVAAGSVVTKTFPPYSVLAGVPAKLVKRRFTEDEIRDHESILQIKESM